MPDKKYARNFTVSEMWGPYHCDRCGKQEAFSFLLTKEENASLPARHGPDAVKFILDNRLGVAICDECRCENV